MLQTQSGSLQRHNVAFLAGIPRLNKCRYDSFLGKSWGGIKDTNCRLCIGAILRYACAMVFG